MADDINKEPYPDGIEETTQGHPEESYYHDDLVVGVDEEEDGKESYPDDLDDDES